MASRTDPSAFAPGGRSVAFEAAAWLARLRNEARTPRDEAAFRAWHAANPRHAMAMALATAAWEAVGGLAPCLLDVAACRRERS
jgi:ferric-dicitrate binding protein FerR (iron transport regulator)